MADRAALIRLRHELTRDLRSASELLDDLRQRRSDLETSTDRVLLGYVAVTLHQVYTALETGFERVCRTLEGSLPVALDSHKALLADMALDLGDLRPPVLSEDTADALGVVLRFRHFVRRTYAVAWDPERLAEVLDVATEVWPAVEREIEAFVAFLDGVTAELDRG